MAPEIIGLIGLGLLVALLAIGVPIAFSAAIVGFLGTWFLAGINPALSALAAVPFSVPANYAFIVLPLFVIMGSFAFSAGLATEAYEVAKRWLGHVPGGLPMATVASMAAFGACTGSTVSSAAVFGRVAIPEMERQGIKPSLAAGVVAAAGPLAGMIPPSGIMVVYAIMAETSLNKQLIAGIIPGVLNAALMALMLFIMVKRNPSLTGGLLPPVSWKQRLSSTCKVWGVFVLATVIIGGIYSGILTASEAAAFGAFAALLILFMRRGITSWAALREAIFETGRIVAMVFLLIIGVTIFANFLALSRVTYSLIDLINGLAVNRYVILAAIMGLYLVLGCFFEAMGMLLLTIPVVIPIVQALGFDLIWFGILVIEMIEIGLLTPPVGLSVYVVKSVAPHIPMGDIFRGIIPFAIVDIIVVAIIMAFPQIALFLPNAMK